MRMNNSYKMRVDGRLCPVRNVCRLHCKSSKSLEGDRGKDRVRRWTMPPLNFISSGRSVRICLPLEKFVDYTHCCESSISLGGGRSKDRFKTLPSFHVISRMSTLEIVLRSKR